MLSTWTRLTLSQKTDFSPSRIERVCSWQFDENGCEFSKRVEKAVGKGEIACYEQFLLFQQCFQKICIADPQKQGLVCERVKFCCLAKIIKTLEILVPIQQTFL